jgi:hypothetical protein
MPLHSLIFHYIGMSASPNRDRARREQDASDRCSLTAVKGVNHTALTLPSSTLAVPPGPYRLFLLDGNRIPSEGIPVQVNP